MEYTYKNVIIGGGIAGVTCAKELSRIDPSNKIALISENDMVKDTKSIMKITRILEDFSVFEKKADMFEFENPNIEIIQKTVIKIRIDEQKILFSDGDFIKYNNLCICSGARPRKLFEHPSFIQIRDVESVYDLAARLSGTRKVIVIGNGGIALEMVHLLKSHDITWIIKDHQYIGSTFFDSAASDFIMPSLSDRIMPSSPAGQHKRPLVDYSSQERKDYTKRMKTLEVYDVHHGSALGPEWATKTDFIHKIQSIDSSQGQINPPSGKIKIFYCQKEVFLRANKNDWNRIILDENMNAEIKSDTLKISQLESDWDEFKLHNKLEKDYPVVFRLSEEEGGAHVYGDVVIDATGVEPNVDFLATDELVRGYRNSILVDRTLKSSVDNIYAAGDCCCVNVSSENYDHHYHHHHHHHHSELENSDDCSNWFQMNLWSQAKWMATIAAQNIGMTSTVKKDLSCNIFFEIFAHTTHFFGYKVVLLGRFNAQGLLGSDKTYWEKEIKEVVSDEKIFLLNDVTVLRAYKVNTIDSFDSSSTGKDLGQVEIWSRVTPSIEYVKLTIYLGRIVGAMLIGDTNLEETFENLILNKLDVSHLGVNILNPDIDIEDYFD